MEPALAGAAHAAPGGGARGPPPRSRHAAFRRLHAASLRLRSAPATKASLRLDGHAADCPGDGRCPRGKGASRGPATACTARRVHRIRMHMPRAHAHAACTCTCRVRVPTVPVRRTTPCIPQVAIDMEAATPCVQAATPCIPQVAIGVEAEVTPVRMQPVLASWCGKAAIIEEGGLSKEAEAEARVEAAAAAAAEARVEAAAAAAAEARVEAAAAAEARVEAAEARVEAAVAARLSHSGGPLVATSDAISPYPMQSHHLELPRSIVGARSSGEAPADEARPTATPMASDPPARSSAQAAGAHRPAVPAAEAAIPIAPPLKTTAAGVVVPALNVGNTDDFLSRLAAAESGERGSSSR